jgi:methyltransferase (TIGR00027 family)
MSLPAYLRACRVALGERGRNPLVPRSTAEGSCAMRAAGALEDDPAIRCPDEMAAGFLGGLNVTTLAKHRTTRGLLLRSARRLRPGAYTHEMVRTKFIDEIVLGEVAAGLDELILLGAGLDSRPYRLAEELQGVRVIEVDHPASQASKCARLRQLLGNEPEHVTFVAIDFTRDDLDAALATAGHERSARTLFVWSGVSFYLPEEAVAEVLSWVVAHSSPRTSIVFDAFWAEAIDGSREYYGARELCRAAAARGEPFRWGIPEGRVDGTLSRYGLQARRTLTGEEGRAVYMTRSDGTLHEPPYGFGVLVHALTN